MPHSTDPDLYVRRWTDAYFSRTREILEKFGDSQVTYAIFMRRPVVSAPRLAINWLKQTMDARGEPVDIDLRYEEGRWVGAGEPIMYITGSFKALCDLETLLLQKIGPACVAAYNAFTIVSGTPAGIVPCHGCAPLCGHGNGGIDGLCRVSRFRQGKTEIQRNRVHRECDRREAHYFGDQAGRGTMPHALIGYAGSTVRAAEMFHEAHPDKLLIVLVDYFGKEVTDSLAVCERFPDLAASGDLGVRVDTPGGRFCEGLDPAESYAVLDRNAPRSIRGYRNEGELRHLIGPGVSAAAVWHLREALDRAGFTKVKIVGSSGFGPEKCRVMALADTPIDIVGTGSYLPDRWAETYATADIVEYDGNPRVKVGREFLLRRSEET